MDRSVFVYSGRGDFSGALGRLWLRVRANRGTASFQYDPDWLQHQARFAVDPTLELGGGAYHPEPERQLFGALLAADWRGRPGSARTPLRHRKFLPLLRRPTKAQTLEPGRRQLPARRHRAPGVGAFPHRKRSRLGCRVCVPRTRPGGSRSPSRGGLGATGHGRRPDHRRPGGASGEACRSRVLPAPRLIRASARSKPLIGDCKAQALVSSTCVRSSGRNRRL